MNYLKHLFPRDTTKEHRKLGRIFFLTENKWLALKNFNTLLDKSNKGFMVFPKSSLRVNPVRVVPITTRLTAPSPNPLYPLTFYLTKEKKNEKKKRKEGGRTIHKIQFTWKRA